MCGRGFSERLVHGSERHCALPASVSARAGCVFDGARICDLDDLAEISAISVISFSGVTWRAATDFIAKQVDSLRTSR